MLVCRCVPVVRSLISVPAGAARMPLLPFLLLSAVGTLVWDAVLIALGAAAGSSWQFDYQSAVLLMVLFTLVVSILPFYLLKRKRRQRRGE